jgi:hypothetical protein
MAIDHDVRKCGPGRGVKQLDAARWIDEHTVGHREDSVTSL